MTDERDRYLGIGKYIHPLNRRDRGIPPREVQSMETVTITPTGQEWPILKKCTAPVHNTLCARRGKGSNKCGCPGAIAAYREYRASRPADDPERVAYRKGLQPKPKAPGAVRKKMPNFRGGTCTTPQGLIVSNKAFTTDATVTGFAARDKAKAQCNKLCPILAECRDWILGEQEMGEYGGVYAGLDIWDRQGRPQRLDANGRVEAVPHAGA